MVDLLIYIGLLAAIVILAIVIILLLANLGAYFTTVALGTTVFINTGGNKKEIWPNVGGYRMSEKDDLDGRHWLIPSENDSAWMKSFFYNTSAGTMWFQNLLWKRFGVRFISWFWPQVHVHKFDIRKGGRRRIEARSEKTPDAPLRSRMVDSEEPTLVDSLLFTVPRPVYVEGVELAGDNSKINLLLLAVFRLVIPVLPVYYLKGDFFNSLDAAVEAAIVDFGATHRVKVTNDTGMKSEESLTYDLWLKLAKEGSESPIEQHLRHLNVSDEYVAKLQKAGKQELVAYIREHLIPEHTDPTTAPGTPRASVAGLIPSGIVPRFGFALISLRIVEWQPHESTKDLARALLAKETQRHTAEGVREEAYGKRDATLAEAEGESKRFLQLVDALVGKGVDPNVAAGVLQTKIRTENIGGKDSKIVTYIESGGGERSSIMIPTSPQTLKDKEVKP